MSTCFAEIPNNETIAAYEESDNMLANGTGKRYTNTSDLFADLKAKDVRNFLLHSALNADKR